MSLYPKRFQLGGHLPAGETDHEGARDAEVSAGWPKGERQASDRDLHSTGLQGSLKGLFLKPFALRPRSDLPVPSRVDQIDALIHPHLQKARSPCLGIFN